MVSMGIEITMKNSEGGVGTGEEMEALKLKVEKSWAGLIYQYLRWALVATKPGPESQVTMELLGKKETSRRLSAAEEVLKQVESESIVEEIQKA
jgi:glutamyl-tRNA synthetase